MYSRFLLLACICISITLFLSGIYIMSYADLGHSRNIPESEGYGNHEISQDPIKKVAIEEKKDQGNERVIEKQVADKESETKQDGKEKIPKPVNILILGLDDEEVRSDVIILMNFKPEDAKLNILSIARDTRVYFKGKPWKINAMMAIGREKLVIDTVERYTGMPVHYYITLNFRGFREIVDTLGGVEFYVPFNMDYDDPAQNLHIHLKKGWQVLDGRKAEQFVRYRKGNRNGQGYEDGDLGRIKAQQEFIKAFIKQKSSFKYISRVDEIFSILKKHMKTNIEIGDIVYYLDYIKGFNPENVEMFTLPGDSRYVDGISYFICDWEKARELINEKFAK